MEETSEKISEEKPAEKTSTWFALRNAIFRRLWLAMVVSGSCIGAYNTAVYWALHSLGANTVPLSLMATVSALPFTLFTLPAGAFADMVDRKKILLGVQLWHAFIAFAMAVLWIFHLLNPYIILASAFLVSTGFAIGSPAHSSVIAEMVSAEELGSAYTLAGLQMDISGIIGPLLSALLLPVAGVSFIFGANGVGFVLMFLAVLQWKRPKAQGNLPLENFFESLTTAIRYVRYSPGIKILLARHAIFSFFISIIPSLMPVVGLTELHWGFLNQAKEAVKQVAEGNQSTAVAGNAVENMTGFSKTKRDLAIKLGVDPYSKNEVFQKELNKVAWPAFLGKFAVNLGMGAVGGPALSAINWTGTLTESLRNKSPAQLTEMNRDLLMNNMGISRATADAFLNNSAFSPTTQTILVGALGQLGNIPGQAEFIRQAANSQDEHDAIASQQSAQIMGNLNKSTPVARSTHLKGLTVCQTNDGTVVVPIQWDYAAWTPMTERFIAALKAQKFTAPPSGYTVILTGVVSPMTAEALDARGVNVKTKALPGPLR
jgi:MFS family permease